MQLATGLEERHAQRQPGMGNAPHRLSKKRAPATAAAVIGDAAAANWQTND
jgi:hypothetical protein